MGCQIEDSIKYIYCKLGAGGQIEDLSNIYLYCKMGCQIEDSIKYIYCKMGGQMEDLSNIYTAKFQAMVSHCNKYNFDFLKSSETI